MDTHMLSQTPLFREIPEEELPELLSGFEAYTQTYGRGDIIYSAGERIACMGLVIKGSVNIVVNYYWGNSNIFSHIAPGQVFAETYAVLPEQELLVDAVAAEPAEIVFLNVRSFLKNPSLTQAWSGVIAQRLLSLTAQKNLNLSNRMLHTASRSIRERLLSYLSQQALEHGSHRFEIPFSRQQLADYLGVDRSAMSHELSKMQQEGILTCRKNAFELKR